MSSTLRAIDTLDSRIWLVSNASRRPHIVLGDLGLSLEGTISGLHCPFACGASWPVVRTDARINDGDIIALEEKIGADWALERCVCVYGREGSCRRRLQACAVDARDVAGEGASATRRTSATYHMYATSPRACVSWLWVVTITTTLLGAECADCITWAIHAL